MSVFALKRLVGTEAVRSGAFLKEEADPEEAAAPDVGLSADPVRKVLIVVFHRGRSFGTCDLARGRFPRRERFL